MAKIAVQKVEKRTAKALPVFEEMEKRFEEVRRRAFELFERRGRQLGRALDDWLNAEHEIFGWPAAELTEADSKYEVQITLPGFEATEVEVTATPSEIIVHAESKGAKKAEESKVLWTEFGPNNVYRCFELPELIDVDKTNATLENGMLHITAAKMPAAKPRAIEVQAA